MNTAVSIADLQQLGRECLRADDRAVLNRRDVENVATLRRCAHRFLPHHTHRCAALYYVGRAAFFMQKNMKAEFFFASAIKSAKPAVGLAPEEAIAFKDLSRIGMAGICFRRSEYDEARGWLGAVENSTHPEILGRYTTERAWLMFKQNNFTEAELLFRRETDRFPMNKYAWNGLGNVLQRTNRLDEAEKCLMRSVSLDEFYEHDWNDLGYLYLRAGKTDAAERAFLKALEISVFPDALRGLGNAMHRTGHYQQARSLDAFADQLEHGYEKSGLMAAIMEFISEISPAK
jgi:tetratricopeptide (TPR) repeat protein